MEFVMATLTPAYGRDYTRADAAREAFLAGKDFIFNEVGSRWDGKPCSIRDFKADETPSVTIRYNHLRSSIVVDL
jgi:hypothetical protein